MLCHIQRRSPGNIAEGLVCVMHWRRIRTDSATGRLSRENRRRIRVVGAFPDGKSASMLVSARLKCVADSEWGLRRCLGVSLLNE